MAGEAVAVEIVENGRGREPDGGAGGTAYGFMEIVEMVSRAQEVAMRARMLPILRMEHQGNRRGVFPYQSQFSVDLLDGQFAAQGKRPLHHIRVAGQESPNQVARDIVIQEDEVGISAVSQDLQGLRGHADEIGH